MRTAKTVSLLTSAGAALGMCTVIAAGPVGVAAADSTEHSTNTAEADQPAAGPVRSGGSKPGELRRPGAGSTPPGVAPSTPVGSRSPVGRRATTVPDSAPGPIDRRERLLDDSPTVPAAADTAGRTRAAPAAPSDPAAMPDPVLPPAPESPALHLPPPSDASLAPQRAVSPTAARPDAGPVASVAVGPGRIGPLADVFPAGGAPQAAPAAVMRAAATSGLSVLNPLAGNGNGLPALAPVSWVVAAAARREWGLPSAATAVRPAAQPTTSAVLPAAVNRAPVISSVVVGRGDPTTGVVTAVITARDPDNDRITFRTTSTTRGRATISSGGALTYTPTSAARHAAAKEQAAPQALYDTLTVTVADTKGARTSTAVTVPIVGRNILPVTRTSVGTPNASTGVVTGRVSATDADGDALTFSAPATTAKGAVRLGTTGDFTYTPSSAARHAAARTGASTADKADAFTVTVRDGYGGVVNVAVTVSISPKNTAPVAATPTVGTPDAVTGVVTGSVRATDSDGDVLTYSAPATTAKGSLTVNPGSGAFTYTPTPAARNIAASPGATDADRRDGFTVTVTDGYGGSTPLAVSVPVSPKASTPSSLPAFPGAEGFGASATGGRAAALSHIVGGIS